MFQHGKGDKMKRRFFRQLYIIMFISEVILFIIMTMSTVAYAGAGMEASHPYELINPHIIYNFLTQPIQSFYSESQGVRMTFPLYERPPVSLIRSYLQMRYETVTHLYSQTPYVSFYMPYYASYENINKQFSYSYYIPCSLSLIER